MGLLKWKIMTAKAATPRRPSRQFVLARCAATIGFMGREEVAAVVCLRTEGMANWRTFCAAEAMEVLKEPC